MPFQDSSGGAGASSGSISAAEDLALFRSSAEFFQLSSTVPCVVWILALYRRFETFTK